jgi:hypothetical protein
MLDHTIHIKKSHLDILFSLDITENYLLKAVLYVEEFDLENALNVSKEVPQNVNLFPEIQTLLRDVHTSYLTSKLKENNFNDTEKVNASSFVSGTFETHPRNILSLRVNGNNFLLKRKINLKNFHAYTHDAKPESHEIINALKHLDYKKVIIKQANFKDNKVKELKPTKVDLSKIPVSYYDDDDVDAEYKRLFLKQTTLSNPVSSLTKDTFLKHKRRRTTIPKPTKSPAVIQHLYNEYQNILSNVKLSTLNKYSTMQKYKDTISNIH